MSHRCPDQPKSAAARGFSLIELLVVIAIIAILAGLVLQTAGYAQRRGATARAEAEIKALEAALESYKADFGEYPRGTNIAPAQNNAFLRAALAPSTGKVYFTFPKAMGPTGANPNNTDVPILDPFGEGYGYEFEGRSNRSGANFFDLWSRGGAGTNTNAWIKNW
jgi:general secretion pathway protein G